MNYEEAIIICNEKVKNGESIENIVPFLKLQSFQILPSIKIIREVFGIPLGDAKQKVAGHIVWRDKAEQMDLIHKEIITQLNEDF